MLSQCLDQIRKWKKAGWLKINLDNSDAVWRGKVVGFEELVMSITTPSTKGYPMSKWVTI